MKPRIKWSSDLGAWLCFVVLGPGECALGGGKTPYLAYRDAMNSESFTTLRIDDSAMARRVEQITEGLWP